MYAIYIISNTLYIIHIYECNISLKKTGLSFVHICFGVHMNITSKVNLLNIVLYNVYSLNFLGNLIKYQYMSSEWISLSPTRACN